MAVHPIRNLTHYISVISDFSKIHQIKLQFDKNNFVMLICVEQMQFTFASKLRQMAQLDDGEVIKIL